MVTIRSIALTSTAVVAESGCYSDPEFAPNGAEFFFIADQKFKFPAAEAGCVGSGTLARISSINEFNLVETLVLGSSSSFSGDVMVGVVRNPGESAVFFLDGFTNTTFVNGASGVLPWAAGAPGAVDGVKVTVAVWTFASGISHDWSVVRENNNVDGGYVCRLDGCAPLTFAPTASPTTKPPTKNPTRTPTNTPSTKNPTRSPTNTPSTKSPTRSPTVKPTTESPTAPPTISPSKSPTRNPSRSPSKSPTKVPTSAPTQQTSLITTGAPTPNVTSGTSEAPSGLNTFSPTPEKDNGDRSLTPTPGSEPSPSSVTDGLSEIAIGLVAGLLGFFAVFVCMFGYYLKTRHSHLQNNKKILEAEMIAPGDIFGQRIVMLSSSVRNLNRDNLIDDVEIDTKLDFERQASAIGQTETFGIVRLETSSPDVAAIMVSRQGSVTDINDALYSL